MKFRPPHVGHQNDARSRCCTCSKQPTSCLESGGCCTTQSAAVPLPVRSTTTHTEAGLMETVLGCWVPCTLVQASILGGRGHTGPLRAMSESLVPPIRAAPPGAEMEGYTEPKSREAPPTAHACAGSGTWLEGPHWATIRCVGVAKAADVCGTVGMSGGELH